MGGSSAKRIQNELGEIISRAPGEFSACPKGDNVFEWSSTIHGPRGTPYEGGYFFLDISFSQEYPFQPPKVSFRTRIYHCNVGLDGALGLAILGKAWSPALTIASVLAAICDLLKTPKPDEAVVGVIAYQFCNSRKAHDATAADWTTRFAKA